MLTLSYITLIYKSLVIGDCNNINVDIIVGTNNLGSKNPFFIYVCKRIESVYDVA